MHVMTAESGDNPLATDHDSDGSTDYGLMQVNSVHSRLVNGNLTSLYDPATNVRVAYEVWQHSGWCAWTTAKKLGYCK